MGSVVAFAAALAAAVVLMPVARRASFAFGVLDQPGPLKVQREPVPYLGGAAVFVALSLALIPTHPAWIIPLGLAVALGVADDVRPISPLLRLFGQASVGCVAGLLEPAPGPVGIVLTALFVVVFVNAINLIDGMDALAASVVVMSALGFALVGGAARVPAAAVCGALIGFLFFNRPPARIYLGDGGSYLLGTALALLAASALESQPRAAWIALPFFVGLPLGDTAIAILRRARAGLSVLAGDRSHVYDQLADRGWSVSQVVAVCASVQLLAALVGLLCLHLALPTAAITALAALLLCALGTWRLGLVRREAAV
jgi:UDP-GlcNAc:undecaprenyl-phosphate GlcNAc-1-phosphate transferase